MKNPRHFSLVGEEFYMSDGTGMFKLRYPDRLMRPGDRAIGTIPLSARIVSIEEVNMMIRSVCAEPDYWCKWFGAGWYTWDPVTETWLEGFDRV